MTHLPIYRRYVLAHTAFVHQLAESGGDLFLVLLISVAIVLWTIGMKHENYFENFTLPLV